MTDANKKKVNIFFIFEKLITREPPPQYTVYIVSTNEDINCVTKLRLYIV